MRARDLPALTTERSSASVLGAVLLAGALALLIAGELARPPEIAAQGGIAVDIVRDRYGVPDVYVDAGGLRGRMAAAYAGGYAQAEDRLFQMDLFRRAAIGRLAELPVYGNDYPTPDGTGVRDYIHVMDLALGHERALARLGDGGGVQVWNLGTGRGYSVLEMISAFERASGRKVAYRLVPRRPGDIAVCYADPARANAELAWTAKRGLEEMCVDTWRWQKENPDGFA
jgi:hypothetical protein